MKGSKDSYYSLDFNKTLNREIGSLGRLPKDDDAIPKLKNLP